MADIIPPAGFYFVLRVGGGLNHAVFQEASGLGPEMELESVREGGENRFVHQLPKAVKNGLLTLKRGLVPPDSELFKWCQDVLEGGLTRPIKAQQIELDLLDAGSQPLMSWLFDNAYPLKWSVMDVRAETNTLLLETIELAYTTVKRKP
jgi:phage tail-like protein